MGLLECGHREEGFQDHSLMRQTIKMERFNICNRWMHLFFCLNDENVYIAFFSLTRSKRNQDKVEIKPLNQRACNVMEEIGSSKEKVFPTGPRGS